MASPDELPGLPPEPDVARRPITPAPEDYARRASLRDLVWPVLWLGALVGLAYVLTASGWTEAASHDDAAHSRIVRESP